jgi:hypothetical protein
LDKRKNLHGYQNGEIVFIDAFAGESGSFLDQPTPATTKVSIKDDCVNLPGIYQTYLDEKKRIEDEKTSERKAREKELKDQRKKKVHVPAPVETLPHEPAHEPVSASIPLVPLTLSSVTRVVSAAGAAAGASTRSFQQPKYATSMHLASCDGLYIDIPEKSPSPAPAVPEHTCSVATGLASATTATAVRPETVKTPNVPKSKTRQAFLPEEVVSVIRHASKYMSTESFASFKAEMNSKYSLGME